MNDLNNAAMNRLLERILLNPRAGDDLVLDDEALEGAILGDRPLNRAQLNRLMRSPLTLRRFRHLSNGLRSFAVAGWRGSEGLLLAAASDDALPEITTEDGHWALRFVRGRGGEILALLRCAGPEPLRQALSESEKAVELVDAQGIVLLKGVLDERGELDGRWEQGVSPRDYLRQRGGGFRVRLAKR